MRIWPLVLILCGIGQACADDAADADGDELHPGLVARYSAGGKSIERVDPDVQFVWKNAVPDQRLAAGPFEARWTGQVLIRGDARHAFHLYLCGEATLTIDDKEVVEGAQAEPAWVAGVTLTLEPGEHQFELRFRHTAPGTAVIRLFWASEAFPLEPVPPGALFHNRQRLELAAVERGRDLFGALRCNRCHRRDAETLAPASAALSWGAVGLSRAWLTDWLSRRANPSPHARMPSLGFTRDEARAVAEALIAQARPLEAKATPVADRTNEFRRGEVLFRSVGCLACHTHGDLGTQAAFGGGDLTQISNKRSEAWLLLWLKEPQRLNPGHRMPVFKLSDDERRDLAIYLSGLQPPEPATPDAKPDAELVASGKQLIQRARCVACHHDGDARLDLAVIGRLDRPIADWSSACSEAPADRERGRPTYSLTESQRRDLRTYVDAYATEFSAESVPAAAQRVLKHNNCLNCHERDGGQGLARVAKQTAERDADLAGQSDALIPPDLTAVGDKLHGESLMKAVRGEQEPIRLPWLRVRMPRFQHSADDSAHLREFLIGHDRIPESSPQAPWQAAAAQATVPSVGADELLRVGRVLAGTRGFSCVGCHKVGKFEPRNVALATRGSDLYGMVQRMRPEYFNRWVRSPIRVIPNMEMPSFDKAHPDLMDGNYDVQMAALWGALNDPKGPPTLDTSLIEQTLVVQPGAFPEIIRDVFNAGDVLSPKFVPRAMAIGFGNRANVLFDLDTFSLRAVWTGDFARQRAVGKSWFWEAAGPPAQQWDHANPDLALRPAGQTDAPPIVAERESGRFGRLLKYGRHGAGVRVEYRLTFKLPRQSSVVQVTEDFLPRSGATGDDWAQCTRSIRVDDVPSGFEVLVRDQSALRSLGPARHGTQSVIGEWNSGKIPVASVSQPGRPGPPAFSSIEPIRSVPGYDGVRLPLPWSIMPTAIAWTRDGTLAFCTLKGQVYFARDTSGDGIEDSLSIFEEGLAAPYGLIADGDDLLVAHKPELLRLRDTDRDGRADWREVIADGWGYTDDYHDWTTGIVRDSQGNLYIGTGSDYAKPGRDREKSQWRGKVLRVGKEGEITPLGHAFRYPTGLAITPDDQVFVTDNQGVQNPFNEINHLVTGGRYGVPSLFEEPFESAALAPAIQVPHPWTRSVNGIFFLPREETSRARTNRQGPHPSPFAGHGIGCEYDGRFLVRFTLQKVGDTWQGAVYPFSRMPGKETEGQFRGTICGAVAPSGDIYIGSFLDSGWLGGPNVGDLVRLRPQGTLPCGIREIQAYEREFVVSFTAPVDKEAAARPENYDIAGYTRTWQGAYATPDSGRHKLAINRVDVAENRLSATLHVDRQKAGHVYEINVGRISPDPEASLWPAVGHYTMNRVPMRD
ncbi:MAG: c-type cytochrome [Planctomycetaceae bacterium]|nr:c-type cytochrome [Planctomycetaceae bacterium]